MNPPPGLEKEYCQMIVECCMQERTYLKFYGLMGQRFCQLKREWQAQFEALFAEHYTTVHRLEINRLRNNAKFFAHLLATDAISWAVLQNIRLNEQDTTSSSRIFIKILFQELCEFFGSVGAKSAAGPSTDPILTLPAPCFGLCLRVVRLKKLNERILDPFMREFFAGLFPKDNPRNTRFAINFFTSIGLGGLTYVDNDSDVIVGAGLGLKT